MALYGISGGQRRALGSRYRDYAADLALKRLEEEYALAPGREARNLQASQFQQSLAQSGSQFQQNLAQNASQFQQNLSQQNRQLESQETAGMWSTGANLLQGAGMLRALTMNKGEPFFGKTITEGAGGLWDKAWGNAPTSGITASGIPSGTPVAYTPTTYTPGMEEMGASTYGGGAAMGGMSETASLYSTGGDVTSTVGAGAAEGAGSAGAGMSAGGALGALAALEMGAQAAGYPQYGPITATVDTLNDMGDWIEENVTDPTGRWLDKNIFQPVKNVVSGDTVICTELARQGIVPWEQIELEHKYHNFDWATYAGYRLWADTVVGWMKRSKIVTKMVKPFGVAFLKEVAHRVEPERKGSWFGSLIIKVGVPICRWNYSRIAGRVVPKEVG